MYRRATLPTRPDALLPYTTLFRSRGGGARARLVVPGPGGGEPEGAGLDRSGDHATHLGDLLGGGHLLVVGAALAHHVQSNGGVGHLGGDVDRKSTRLNSSH